ncbi:MULTISPECIES: c-type cytochrome [Vibrio]|jgi:cytochrome c553|uniref:Cytochrome c n=2 Tax=Vibrio TaxID=662 RepID=A0A2C9P847_9VIBR|nr:MULTISPECIES: c-type cytochrome [Vibrio]ASI88833.1 cytochrome C biogenesis protein CcsB [Vibrio mediterranei]AYV20788.1 cytochrome c [Vibrio mediterranei]MCF4175412.1 c-type cytochrome [Vibrio sp. McD22-P3]MCG9657433.1 c-type cytochrome [Vibrio mediterranei]MCG9665765.1 c-type cytochrome [Vibrio mediterranei]|eukprot:TRINITY_DN33133_c2_g2_i1.p1 TRINITY_DN33133_c2_g2~~TRINITY_DN33133_c2_g2_i1.p1  ORF type:complete len:104 (-),score=18.42 TRINITY_DN33133_c2_g2_i1:118-429(-)
MKNMVIGAVLAAGLLSGTAMAADIEAGKAKAAICAACHGADGIAVIPGYPNLKGQNEQYLATSIKAYKNKERTGGLAAVMQAQASMLSDEDIANVAAYYASLK